MQLTRDALRDRGAWEKLDISLPLYDVAAMAERTIREPIWVHFGAGNIFRAFPAVLQQRLLNDGLSDKGIIAVETFDSDIIGQIYAPHDNLTLSVTLDASGMDCEIIASVAEAFAYDARRLAEIFSSPSLQTASFTITEKGYGGGVMDILAAAMYARYNAGRYPVALVSMDNLSANGDVLKAGVLRAAEAMTAAGEADAGFLVYLRGGAVSYPWSMIDKITPRPDASVADMLARKGVTGMEPKITSGQTHIAPFVNAERPQCLVIEDDFPNGRPPLERAGVIFTDRAAVSKIERMKVTVCLNPLHTAMAVCGCLLGYTRISDETCDEDIAALIRRLGYIEGLPAAPETDVISARAFLDVVINERLPNPFLPDTPQRIATDTSQKAGIRFGETIKSYIAENLDLSTLIAIPLTLAGWLRYLLGVDDQGAPMDVSPDPRRAELRSRLDGVTWDDPASYNGQLAPILADGTIFGLDLTGTVLAARIEEYFVSMLGGAGAVRDTLRRVITQN